LVRAEIEEVDSSGTGLYAQDFSHDAFCFADVMAGFAEGDAIGGGQEWSST